MRLFNRQKPKYKVGDLVKLEVVDPYNQRRKIEVRTITKIDYLTDNWIGKLGYIILFGWLYNLCEFIYYVNHNPYSYEEKEMIKRIK